MKRAILACALLALATNAASQPLPDELRSAGVTVQEYNDEIATIRALANARGAEARNALARLFAERAWSAMERGDYPLAARYALAGWRVSPANESEFRGALGRLMHDVADSRPLLAGDVAVITAALSPDQVRVATGMADSTVRLWDAETGRALAVMRGHPGSVTHVAYSGVEHVRHLAERRIATRDMYGGLRLWDQEGGAIAVLRERGVGAFAFSHDGTRIVAAIQDTQEEPAIYLWDALSGREIARLPGLDDIILSVTFSRDGELIAVASEDNGVRLLSARTGELVTLLTAHRDDVVAVAFGRCQYPARCPLLTASRDGAARVWAPNEEGDWETLFVMEHGAPIGGAAFDSAGANVVTFGGEVARVWSTWSGRQSAVLRGHEGEVLAASIGNGVTTLSADGTARTWAVSFEGASVNGEQIFALRGHDRRIDGAVVGWLALRAVTWSDGVARVWEPQAGRRLFSLRGHRGAIIDASFSPDAARVVTASEDGTARIWTMADRGAGEPLQLAHDALSGAVFSPDSARVMTTGVSAIRIWDAASGAEMSAIRGGSQTTGVLRNATFSQDGARIVGGAGDTARVWNAATGEELLTLRGHRYYVENAVFSGDGRRIATSAWAEDVRVWDAATGREIAILAGSGSRRPEFSSDGRRILVGNRVWDVASGRLLVALQGHNGGVASARFSAEGSRIVTAGGDDHTVRIWDAESGRELAVLPQRDYYVTSAAFSADGTRLVVATREGLAFIWSVYRMTQPMSVLARDACSTMLTPRERRFRRAEIAADPLIREVWLRGGRSERDVCEGVAGAPALD